VSHAGYVLAGGRSFWMGCDKTLLPFRGGRLVESMEFPRLLIDAAGRPAADALVPAGPSGRPEPLCAVYHRGSRRALEGALGRGVRSVRAAVEDLRAAVVYVPEVTPFQNVNTPEEWAAYAAK